MKYLILILSITLLSNCANNSKNIYCDDSNNIKIIQKGKTLIVSNGITERTWKITDEGLLTTSIKNYNTGKIWNGAKAEVQCDWSYDGWIGNGQKANLISITANEANDDGYTSQHVEVVAEFEYPNVEAFVKYVIWIYPNVSGVRTQVYIKGNNDRIEPGKTTVDENSKNIYRGRVDYLPINSKNMIRFYAGYYNDTQHRNTNNTPILKEETLLQPFSDKEENWWANIYVAEENNEGIIIVKESHKCVNQYGVETGTFISDTKGIYNTGTSLLPEEISKDEYKWFWGSWTIPYKGDETNRQLALKRFDRKRFPINVDRDMYSLVCTWGHSLNPRDGRNAATEKEVLNELDYVKEINVDMLLIDDGWQISLKSTNASPDEGQGWKPAPSNYPEGWINVGEKSKKLGIRLGLWGVAQEMPANDMIWNYEHLGMEQLKLDFAVLGTHDKLANLVDTVRKFQKATNHKCIISWDLTEIDARYGYFWAREYGNLHFMNRKPFTPVNVLYVPHLALRDFWQLSHFNNLNKYQLVIQHAKASNKISDAHKHPEIYCVSTALMGIPEFMAIPRYYQPEDRKEIAKLMSIYKKHQENIFTGFVFPLGNEPNNKSWSGFQSIMENNENEGYFIIYRELENNEASQEIKVNFINPGTKVKINNLLTNEIAIQEVTNNNTLRFSIISPADFLFLRWKIIAE